MSGTLKTSNLQHKDSADPNIQLYADGSTSIRNLQNLAPSLIVNGAMTVAQRGVGPVSDAGYQTADRLATTYTSPQSNCSQEVSTDNPPAGFTKFFRFKNLSAITNAASDWRELYYKVEAQDVVNCGWNQKSSTDNLSLSFYVRSSVTQKFYCRVSTLFGGSADLAYAFEIDCTANTWTQASAVIPGDASLRIPDDNTEGIRINIVPFWGTDYTGSTVELNKWKASDGALRTPDYDTTWASTVNATFDVTGIQLTHTDAPIEFQHEDYGTTLAKCQRYYATNYDRTYPLDNSNQTKLNLMLPWVASPNSTVAAAEQVLFSFKTTMRAAPTVTTIAPNGTTGSFWCNATTVTLRGADGTTNQARIFLNGAGTFCSGVVNANAEL